MINNCPCKNCILLPICKIKFMKLLSNYEIDLHYAVFKIIKQCSILDKYIGLSSTSYDTFFEEFRRIINE